MPLTPSTDARPRSIDLASADDESDADSDDVDGEATGNSLKPRRSGAYSIPIYSAHLLKEKCSFVAGSALL